MLTSVRHRRCPDGG